MKILDKRTIHTENGSEKGKKNKGNKAAFGIFEAGQPHINIYQWIETIQK